MRHFALSRLLKGDAFGVFPVTRRGCRYAFNSHWAQNKQPFVGLLLHAPLGF